MEVSIMIVFASSYVFQNISSLKDEMKVAVIIVLFVSQFIIMIMTVSQAIREILIKQKERKINKILKNTTSLTEKNISGIGLDKSGNYDSFFKSKTPEKEKEYYPKIGIKEEVKGVVEEKKSSDGVVSPMRYISEFEEMGDDKDINSKIATIHNKILKNLDTKKQSKKSKLSKLLHKMKKKKHHDDDQFGEETSVKDSKRKKKSISHKKTTDITSKPSVTNIDPHTSFGKDNSDNSSPPEDITEILTPMPEPQAFAPDVQELGVEKEKDKLSVFSSIDSKLFKEDLKNSSSDENKKDQPSDLESNVIIKKPKLLKKSEEKKDQNEEKSSSEEKRDVNQEKSKESEKKSDEFYSSPDLEKAQSESLIKNQ